MRKGGREGWQVGGWGLGRAKRVTQQASFSCACLTFMLTHSNDFSTNSRTEWHSLVASTKSSGSSRCRGVSGQRQKTGDGMKFSAGRVNNGELALIELSLSSR